MANRKSNEKTVRQSTVQYSHRANHEHGGMFRTTSYTEFPRISVAGLWLEELGFHIGDKLKVECGEGYLHISLAEAGMVCEDTHHYEVSRERSSEKQKNQEKGGKAQ